MSPIEHAPTETTVPTRQPDTMGRSVVDTSTQGAVLFARHLRKDLDVPSTPSFHRRETVGGGFAQVDT